MIPKAMNIGYRHFDTALFYNSQRVLGNCLGKEFSEGSFTRQEVFITTKVFHDTGRIGLNKIGNSLPLGDESMIGQKLKDAIAEQIERCMSELMLGYIDLLLMHWPGEFFGKNYQKNRQQRKDCWEVFEEYLKQGKLKAIGVSNFTKKHIEDLMEDCSVAPMVNQLEINPYMAQPRLVQYCQSKGIFHF